MLSRASFKYTMNMSEETVKTKVSSLDELRSNQEAISLIRELYNVDENLARELWERFINTVKKMKSVEGKRMQSAPVEDP
jgi:hypothetical protein